MGVMEWKRCETNATWNGMVWTMVWTMEYPYGGRGGAGGRVEERYYNRGHTHCMEPRPGQTSPQRQHHRTFKRCHVNSR